MRISDWSSDVCSSDLAGQLHQSAIVTPHLQLSFRAKHATGFDTAELGLLDLEVARQLSTDHCKRDLQAGPHIRGSADDLKGFTSIADLTDPKLVGIRMLHGFEDLTNNHTAEAASNGGNSIHHQPTPEPPSDQPLPGTSNTSQDGEE